MADVIILRSQDGQEVRVSRPVAEMSVTVRNILSDIEDLSNPLELPSVSGCNLERIIEYCKHAHAHPAAPAAATASMSEWDAAFCQRLDQAAIVELVLASNFMDVKPLTELLCQHLGNQIRGKTAAEIRQHFNIKNDFTPEEEQQVKNENQWVEMRV